MSRWRTRRALRRGLTPPSSDHRTTRVSSLPPSPRSPYGRVITVFLIFPKGFWGFSRGGSGSFAHDLDREYTRIDFDIVGEPRLAYDGSRRWRAVQTLYLA